MSSTEIRKGANVVLTLPEGREVPGKVTRRWGRGAFVSVLVQGVCFDTLVENVRVAR